MEEIARLDHVYQYNELMGIETLHPLVSVIDMSKCPRMRHSRRLYGFYCIFLKDVKCGDLRYGRNYYDYQEGTLVFTAPGQVVGVEDNGEVFQPKGWALLFHPDLIRGTSLGRNIGRYMLPSERLLRSNSTHHPHIPDVLFCCNLRQKQRTPEQILPVRRSLWTGSSAPWLP